MKKIFIAVFALVLAMTMLASCSHKPAEVAPEAPTPSIEAIEPMPAEEDIAEEEVIFD